MKKFIALFVFICAGAHTVMGQQDPLYALYLNNPLTINPAYAGSNDRFHAGAQYRSQWAGIEGNPVTLHFNTHLSLFDNRVGAGLMAVQDRIADVTLTDVSSVFAYKLKVSEGTLSFGMNFGFTRYATNTNLLQVRDSNDPYFVPFNSSQFTTGAGFLLKQENYVVGLSLPRLIKGTVTQGPTSIQVYDQHLYLMGQYRLLLTERLRLKPAVLMRYTPETPVAVDINAMINLDGLYSVGLFTRNLSTVGLLAQLILAEYRLGYALELPSGPASQQRYTTHEFSLVVSASLLKFHSRSPEEF